MENFRRALLSNPHKSTCVEVFDKNKIQLNSPETLWGGEVRRLTPAKLVTAWLTITDPLVIIAGQTYTSTKVRDTLFEVQQNALEKIRGNRKLTRAKMADALSSMKPTKDDTRITAAVLWILHKVQTVCFDLDTKTIWTEPQDLRQWSFTSTTLWIDSMCERVIDWSDSTSVPLNMGRWLSDLEHEGWTIPWPHADGTFEELKQKISSRNLSVRPANFGDKPKKEDWARTLGKTEAIEHLLFNK